MRHETINLSRTPAIIKAAAKEAPGFKIKMQETGDGLDILIMDYIGDDGWGGGFSAFQMSEILADNRTKRIDLKVNSLGGSFYEGLSMYNDLIAHPQQVTATITGIAFSAATLPVMAAEKVIMPAASDFGIHRAWTLAMGNSKELGDVVDWLESVDVHAANLYANKSGASLEQVNQWMDGISDGTKFSANEALEAGFADEVIELTKPAATARNKAFAQMARIQQQRIKAKLA
jgi:ATP-dependent Clp protease protease subunit